MTVSAAVSTLVVIGVVLPFALLALLGSASLIKRPFPEKVTGHLVPLVCGGSLVAFVLAWPVVWATPNRQVFVRAGSVLDVSRAAFEVELLADPVSLWFAALASALCGVASAFAHRYLHKERGYNRFFVLFTVFFGGMLLVVLAGSIDVLFAGWEFLGLGSALLVAFFIDRAVPVKNALRIFVVYRVGDAAMLSAAVLIHHLLGTGSFGIVLGGAAGGEATMPTSQATLIGGLLLIAAAAKCGQIPFSGWLPRAMEGPTPSSAVFYGALSIHAGAYLLLRAEPILRQSAWITVALAAMGVATALHATIVGRVQTDVKSALAYASLTQVSIVLVEIAFGLELLAVVHMTGHACLRLLQFLRSPSMLHDFRRAENAIGGHLAHTGDHLERIVPKRLQWRLYHWALERGHLDSALDRFLVLPFQRALTACDTWERRLADRLIGGSAPTSIEASSSPPEETHG